MEIPKRTRVYRHCRNRRCATRLKTGQHVLCASCRVMGGWGMVVAGAVVGTLKAFGVL